MPTSLSESCGRWERSVLGCLLESPESWPEVSSLNSDHFNGDNRRIYEAIAHLHSQSCEADIEAVIAQLGEKVSPEYVGRLIDGTVRADLSLNVRRLREAVQDKKFLHQVQRLQAVSRDERAQLLREMQDALNESAGGRIQTLADIPDPFSLPGGEIEWLVDGLIPKGGVTLLISDPGCGKTWLAHSLAKAASLGGQFLERQTLRMPVLYLDRENPLALVRERLSILCGGPGVFNPWGTWCQEEPP